MDKNFENAKNYFNSFPKASIKDRLLLLFIGRVDSSTGLTKEDIAKIVYEKELKTSGLNIDKAKTRISANLASLRKNKKGFLLFSQRILDAKNKKTWKVWVADSEEDQLEVIKRLLAQMLGIENTVDRIESERKKSSIIKLKYKEDLEKLKKEIEAKIKRKNAKNNKKH